MPLEPTCTAHDTETNLNTGVSHLDVGWSGSRTACGIYPFGPQRRRNRAKGYKNNTVTGLRCLSNWRDG
jgi:hypothetical protein